jgi:hypothetical protein
VKPPPPSLPPLPEGWRVERDAETNKDVFVNDATQQRLGTHPVRVQERRKRRVLTSLGFNCRCSTRRLKLIEKDFSCSSNNNSSSSNRRKGKEKKKKTVFLFPF